MNDAPLKFKRRRERAYSAHHAMQHIAFSAALSAEREEKGRFNNSLVAITLSGLSVEAMANAIGVRIVPHWSDFESASPFAKARLLAEHLQLEYSPEAEPWATLRWLSKMRNRLAHAKPEQLSPEDVIEGHGLDVGDMPESKLELEITPVNARRAVDAVESLKHLLCDRIPAEQRFGLNIDGWITSTELSA